MGSNSFGTLFKITTWGESHGDSIGVVIDGCPAGIVLEEKEIQEALQKRAPGGNKYTSPRKEQDRAQILSGLFEGKTTGAPLAILIKNHDVDSSKYEPLKNILRPGHAHFTYQEKYGIFDYRGGGRASARETAARVAAGAVAKKFLSLSQIEVLAYITQIGPIKAHIDSPSKSTVQASPLFCPDECASKEMEHLLAATIEQKDSLGALVEFIIHPIPPGLGDPIYEKLEAKLASAMMSIPASKGFEIGSGFAAVSMNGSTHNDSFFSENGKIKTTTNHAGGVLAGISTGMPLIGRVAFKPTSSIAQPQKTLTADHESIQFTLPEGSRHDPCVGIRAVPIVEAMAALVIADALLLNRCAH